MNWNQKYELIDLTQDIYEGMPLYGIHQKTNIMVHQTHEESMEATGCDHLGFYARNLLISEHAGTHTDAVLEYKIGGTPLDKMPLEFYYGDAICLDVSHLRYPNYIEISDLKTALNLSRLDVRRGDIVLLYTGLYNREYPGPGYENHHTGLSYDAAEWLAEQGVVNFGIDTPAIDQSPDDLDFSGHWICQQYDITNTEHLANLDKVAGRRFLYFGLPLKIREGTGSPIRAVAFLEKKSY